MFAAAPHRYVISGEEYTVALKFLSSSLALSILWACFTASSAPEPADRASSGCRPPDSFFVQARFDYFRILLTSTDSAQVAARDSLGLSKVSANKVNLVTKQTTCVNAVNALNTLLGESGTNRLVWVYALGNDYAVVDPELVPPPKNTPIHIFTRNWTYKVTIVGI